MGSYRCVCRDVCMGRSETEWVLVYRVASGLARHVAILLVSSRVFKIAAAAS